MSEQTSQNSGPRPWQVTVAVEEVGESGQHFDLVADASVRAALAPIAAVSDLSRLEAKFDVMPHGDGGLRVTGVVSATVVQNCVVTLEPLTNAVEEDVDLRFVPPPAAEPHDGKNEERGEPRDVKWNDPEPLIGGAIDLGALATEFLLVGIDPYPRKPGAVFEPPQDVKRDPGPFAALGRLAKGRDGG
jgi:hypothetical protein